MNPTTDVFEQRIAALEGGVAGLATRQRPGGGDAGHHNIWPAPATRSSRRTSLYGGTYNLFHYTLPKLGITVRVRGCRRL